MSLLRHREIYPSDGGAMPVDHAPAHRLEEFPAGYSLAGWSPPEPASASPAVSEYPVTSSCRSSVFQPTANSVLTICVSPGGKRNPTEGLHLQCRSDCTEPGAESCRHENSTRERRCVYESGRPSG